MDTPVRKTGKVDVQLSTPKELGGSGGSGTNPEQLFAAGYSACFIGALKVAGQQLKTPVPADTSITATVGIGPRSEGGFGITADLLISLPGIGREDAQRLVDTAHQICPYSNATRNNVDRAADDCLKSARPPRCAFTGTDLPKPRPKTQSGAATSHSFRSFQCLKHPIPPPRATLPG